MIIIILWYIVLLFSFPFLCISIVFVLALHQALVLLSLHDNTSMMS